MWHSSDKLALYIMTTTKNLQYLWLLLKSDTAIQRYSDIGTGTWNRNLEPEPGTVHNLCKLEHFAPQEIYIIIIYRGGRAQFNDNIQYYMQGILIFKQNKE
jgi:hypothetical protein